MIVKTGSATPPHKENKSADLTLRQEAERFYGRSLRRRHQPGNSDLAETLQIFTAIRAALNFAANPVNPAALSGRAPREGPR
jgi:hypothetical protein